jgi:hypothetical protein
MLALYPGEILTRALRAEALRPAVRYRNGAGCNDPLEPTPADERGESDCSNFTDWCSGLARHEKGALIWHNTDGIERDAKAPGGVWDRILVPRLGATVVYGAGPAVGHCGIVAKLPAEWDDSPLCWQLMQVIDCSSSHQRKLGRAIAWRSGSLFKGKGAIFAWRRGLRE